MVGPTNFKVTPFRSAAYRRFVASLPCANPRCRAKDAVAHHEQEPGKGTMAGKCCDSRTVPLCAICHQKRHGWGRAVWDAWGKDPEQLIAATQELWFKRFGTKPWEGR